MIADMIFSRFGVNFDLRYLCALLGKIGIVFAKGKNAVIIGNISRRSMN
jgi:transposase